ncbi:uncharacterized protein LOC6568588 isoform X2 [Drosophila grimshawi]|uniref:uncharacterized protein LOC6568588 isoform X2 n=1 Tax=Drosophila grimshawi TaxID=7222 RepID=UPI000C86FA36|nr:uncharacterized protein LOC6568588 isoform X2 [Drosophila grimshawi]
MFLNEIGQPLILDSKKTYSPYEREHKVPTSFCDRIIGCAEDVARFQRVPGESKQDYVYRIIRPNEPTEIGNDGNTMLVTLIPAGENDVGESCHLYYLKTDYVRALIVDNLTGYLDFIPKAGALFHRALSNGIDVMYIDDIYFESSDDESLEQREHIYAFAQLIRPRFLFGLRKNNLPQNLLDLCVQKYRGHNQQQTQVSLTL